MLQHVRQRFLHDAVGGERHAGRHVAVAALDADFDLEAGGPDRLDQARQLGEIGRGFVLRAGVFAQHAEHAADLGQRGTAGVGDRLERFLRFGRIGVDDVRAHARLHRDDAHRVRDHVVELLRDAEALVGHRPLRFVVAFALEHLGSLFELLHVEPPVPHRRPEEVRGREDRDVSR